MSEPLTPDEFAATVRNLAVHSPFCAYTRRGQPCDCGLARLLATLDAARESELDVEQLRELLNEPHHLGFAISGKTGTYDTESVLVKREWYDRLMSYRAALRSDEAVKR